MVIAFLLAQLVLPGSPSDSIQPPGMICASGSCERGPMVYRTSGGRSRLVVACDMTSDTCSDGRKITTTRSTPVPCEVSPGVWEMVPANTACISYRGLESWASNTSYLAYGAELDRSPWTSGGAAGHVVRVYDVEGINRICQEAPLSPTSPAGRFQSTPIPTEAGTNTLSCIARPNTGSNIRLNAGDSSKAAIFPMEPGWARYSHSTAVEEGQGASMSVYTLGQTCIDITGCWYTKTSTPGRPCWGGEAPVTCAADRHTISTEGWPTESGEVCVTVNLGENATSPAVIVDGRAASGDVGSVVYWQTTGLYWKSDTSQMAVPGVERGVANHICAGRKGGKLTVRVNGVLHEGPSAPPLAWQPTAILGHGRVASQVINGSLGPLRIRSFE